MYYALLHRMGATCVVQPLDLVKTRMQISGVGGAAKEYKNTFDALSKILKNEGVTGIYKGIGAALLRQATYTTTRLGVYTGLNDYYKKYLEMFNHESFGNFSESQSLTEIWKEKPQICSSQWVSEWQLVFVVPSSVIRPKFL